MKLKPIRARNGNWVALDMFSPRNLEVCLSITTTTAIVIRGETTVAAYLTKLGARQLRDRLNIFLRDPTPPTTDDEKPLEDSEKESP